MGKIYNRRIVLILSLGALIVLSSFLYFFVKNIPHSFVEIDINDDGVFEKGYIKNGIAYLGDFKSDPSWDVVQIIGGDFDNNGTTDFGLSLWKKGNYGRSKPFWVLENDDSYKMHLFLYTWRDGKIQALWHSSNLPKKNLDLKLEDVDGDNKNELIAKEKDYSSWFGDVTIGVWKWYGWGFELLSRE